MARTSYQGNCSSEMTQASVLQPPRCGYCGQIQGAPHSSLSLKDPFHRVGNGGDAVDQSSRGTGPRAGVRPASPLEPRTESKKEQDTPASPPTPAGPKPPGHVPGDSSAHHPAQQRPRRSSRARGSHRPQPPPLLPARLPVRTQAPSPGIARSGWNWGDSGAWPGPPSRPRSSPAAPASPMATRPLQSLLWKSDQALVLQYLLQARIP